MATRKKTGSKRSEPKITMIVTDEKEPSVRVKPGQRLEIQTVAVKSAELKPAKGVAARLCGGTSTCLALVELPEI